MSGALRALTKVQRARRGERCHGSMLHCYADPSPRSYGRHHAGLPPPPPRAGTKLAYIANTGAFPPTAHRLAAAIRPSRGSGSNRPLPAGQPDATNGRNVAGAAVQVDLLAGGSRPQPVIAPRSSKPTRPWECNHATAHSTIVPFLAECCRVPRCHAIVVKCNGAGTRNPTATSTRGKT